METKLLFFVSLTALSQDLSKSHWRFSTIQSVSSRLKETIATQNVLKKTVQRRRCVKGSAKIWCPCFTSDIHWASSLVNNGRKKTKQTKKINKTHWFTGEYLVKPTGSQEHTECPDNLTHTHIWNEIRGCCNMQSQFCLIYKTITFYNLLPSE